MAFRFPLIFSGVITAGASKVVEDLSLVPTSPFVTSDASLVAVISSSVTALPSSSAKTDEAPKKDTPIIQNKLQPRACEY